MMNNNLFRQKSIDNISEPERLDTMITVTSPRAWLFLLAAMILICAGLYWGFAGKMLVKVEGKGIMVKAGGIQRIMTLADGRLYDISVHSGDFFRRGDVLARLEKDNILEKIYLYKKQLDLLKKIDSIGKLNNNVLDELVDMPDIYRLAYNYLHNNSSDAAVRFMAGRSNAMGDLELLIQQSLEKEKEGSQLIAPYDGQVLNVYGKMDDFIKQGTVLIDFTREDLEGSPLEIVAYVSATEGKKIFPGMSVEISPNVVQKEDNGYILGRVTSISDYPATDELLMQNLGSREAVQSVKKDGVVYQVILEPQLSSDTFSGFVWSSGKGPDMKIQNGTLCDISIVIGSQRPIEKLIPSLAIVTESSSGTE